MEESRPEQEAKGCEFRRLPFVYDHLLSGAPEKKESCRCFRPAGSEEWLERLKFLKSSKGFKLLEALGGRSAHRTLERLRQCRDYVAIVIIYRASLKPAQVFSIESIDAVIVKISNWLTIPQIEGSIFITFVNIRNSSSP